MPYPRPILKRFGTSSEDSDSPNSHEGGLSRLSISPNKVHFPKHPDALVRTHLAYSPDVYDRTPITIKPNACALPERGCPGRTYSGDGMRDDMDVDTGEPVARSSTRWRRGDHQHPRSRVAEFLKSIDENELPITPSLVQDTSDTSEDSDNSFSTPFLNNTFVPLSTPQSRRYSSAASSPSSAPIPHSVHLSPKADPAQLAFLPYPHSNPHTGERSPPSFYPSGPPTRDSRPVRRSPSSPTRQRQRSRSRVRDGPVRDQHGADNKHRLYGDREDEGCLGGF